ncbi:decaprenyl-phosphate phosphoribosyltransferase [Acinetobacter faecalis]|uniref:decaprenyl-phosphate phosphoribosyltransferase n=1 Tax=Acinetobacter faecalis TaxID=2665161 RepID=UPI002A919F14|nr:decaprenyl-phosphate phosphoribosyltransferase [Acinetobacter faecalis]MDY6523609.1 decaprenyl-phosphate phosphoribosyltransferase [Acinetobacter faecalis]
MPIINLLRIPIVNLLRPKQWIKNFFVFAPLIFSGELFFSVSVFNALITFLLFCCAASSVYIINDLNDVEKDKLHPKKCKRPLASGLVSKTQAKIIIALLYLVLLTGLLFDYKVSLIIFSYIILNYAYSLYLKHQPVLDIFTIALGFVLRTYAGAVAIGVPISNWMLITVLTLSLYLAAIKREQELLNTGAETRIALKKYTLSLTRKYIEISASCTIVFYSLFVLESRPELIFTVPIILFGIFRYWFINETSTQCESPTDAVIEDKPLLITIVVWLGIVIYKMYLE